VGGRGEVGKKKWGMLRKKGRMGDVQVEGRKRWRKKGMDMIFYDIG
jgi:hypothetical protein